MQRLRIGIFLTLASALAAPLFLALPSAGWAQESERPMPHGRMEMGPRHAEMMEKMQARQEKLDELVAAMEAAEGDAKVDAIADVVRELVSQRRAMADRMQEMHEGMMDPSSGAAPDDAQEEAPGGHAH